MNLIFFLSNCGYSVRTPPPNSVLPEMSEERAQHASKRKRNAAANSPQSESPHCADPQRRAKRKAIARYEEDASIKLSTRYLDEFVKLQCSPLLLESRIFPDAKEISEAMAAFNAFRQLVLPNVPASRQDSSGKNRLGRRCIVCVGDGSTPRCGSLFAFRCKGWESIAIDPQMRVGPGGLSKRAHEEEGGWLHNQASSISQSGNFLKEKECDGSSLSSPQGSSKGRLWSNIDRLCAVRACVEDVIVKCDLAVIVLVHAHVKIEEALKCVQATTGVLAVITNPCCQFVRMHNRCFGRPPDIVYTDPGIFSERRQIRVWVNKLFDEREGGREIVFPANCLENEGYAADEEEEGEEEEEEGSEESVQGKVDSDSKKFSAEKLGCTTSGDSTFGLPEEKSAILQRAFEAGCERPNKKQLKNLCKEAGIGKFQCRFWFKQRRARQHILANKRRLNSRSEGFDSASDPIAKLNIDASERTESFRLRDNIQRIPTESASSLGITKLFDLLRASVGIKGEASYCPPHCVPDMSKVLNGDLSGDTTTDLNRAIKILAKIFENHCVDDGSSSRMFSTCRFHGTVVRKRMCRESVFYSLMPSGMSKSDAERSLGLVAKALNNSKKTSGTKGWGNGLEGLEDTLPTVQVAICCGFLEESKSNKWRAWKRSIKEGDIVECIGTPGRTGSGKSTMFCWDVAIIGAKKGRLEV